MRRVVLLTKNRLNPAYHGARLGAEKVAKTFGVDLVQRVPDGPDRIEDQLDILDEIMADKPDALIIHPYDDPKVGERLRALQRVSVPVVTIVSPLSDVEPLCHVGSDHVELADRVATFACEQVDGRGNAVILDGHANALSTPPRGQGFRTALARFPGITLHAARAGDYRWDVSRDAMNAILVDGGTIDVVLCANDVSALGAHQALAEHGQTARIVGINGSPDAIAAIKAGTMLATAGFNAMAIACIATEATARHLAGEQVPSCIVLPVEVVTRENYLPWDKPYEDRPLPDWLEVISRGPAADPIPHRR